MTLRNPTTVGGKTEAKSAGRKSPFVDMSGFCQIEYADLFWDVNADRSTSRPRQARTPLGR
jgi:hypothetical protein